MTEDAIVVCGTTHAGCVLMLNSWRLMATVIKRVAKALDVPKSAVLDDL